MSSVWSFTAYSLRIRCRLVNSAAALGFSGCRIDARRGCHDDDHLHLVTIATRHRFTVLSGLRQLGGVYCHHSQWPRGREDKGGNCPPPLNFSLQENFLPKIPNLGLEIPIWRGEIKRQNWNFEPLYLLCRKFAALSENFNFLSPTF